MRKGLSCLPRLHMLKSLPSSKVQLSCHLLQGSPLYARKQSMTPLSSSGLLSPSFMPIPMLYVYISHLILENRLAAPGATSMHYGV